MSSLVQGLSGRAGVFFSYRYHCLSKSSPLAAITAGKVVALNETVPLFSMCTGFSMLLEYSLTNTVPTLLAQNRNT